MFTYDGELKVYTETINGIIFECRKLSPGYEQLAQDLVENYEKRLNAIVDFIQPDIVAFFEVSDKNVIKDSLGTPCIDLDIMMITYTEHTLDHVHIIDVEFSGIFERFYSVSVDG